MRENERIVFVEFLDGRPFNVVTATEGRHRAYNLDWCNRDGTLYQHDSGGGAAGVIEVYGRSTYWASAGVQIKEKPSKGYPVKRLKRLPRRWPLSRIFAEAEEGETEYCSTCDDWLPTDDADRICDHIWWCDKKGWWSTPQERCGEDCKSCRSTEAVHA